ncbi:hypothetical protein YC2023_090740 [Brassica napus]
MPRFGVTSSYITSSLSFFYTSHYSNHYHHTTHNHNHSHSRIPFNNLTSSRCFPTHQKTSTTKSNCSSHKHNHQQYLNNINKGPTINGSSPGKTGIHHCLGWGHGVTLPQYMSMEITKPPQ